MLRNERAHNFAARAGLRERNKTQKRERIERAGRALFAANGFELTTTRDIAARAGVASGTFFLYFKEKRDLLFQLYARDLRDLTHKAFGVTTRDDQPLAHQLLRVFDGFTAYYGRNPRLSRVFMKELLFLEPGRREDLLALTVALIARIGEVIARAQASGEVDARVDPKVAASHVFALYCVSLVAWLNGTLSGRAVLRAHIEAQLQLLVTGLAARRSA